MSKHNTDADYQKAIKMAYGDKFMAAELMGITVNALNKRLRANKDLADLQALEENLAGCSASGFMLDCMFDPEKSDGLRMAAAKAIIRRHNDTLCTRGDLLVFQGRMALRAMDAASGPGSPKVPKTGDFGHESPQNR